MNEPTDDQRLARIHGALATARATLLLLDGWKRSPEIFQDQIREASAACRVAIGEIVELGAGRQPADARAERQASLRAPQEGPDLQLPAPSVIDASVAGHDVWIQSEAARQAPPPVDRGWLHHDD